MNELESLNWSAPKVVKTYNGDRVVRVAAPNAAFWGAWRSNKEELKSAGVSCRKDRFGSWEVCRWSDVASEAVLEAAAVVYPTLVEQPVTSTGTARSARRIEGFVAPDISDARPWSGEQKDIFVELRDGTGNFVVMARPGTGKTTVCEFGIPLAPEERGVYLVFMKKNQVEAQSRILDPRFDIITFNAMGFRFVKMFWRNAKPDDEVEKYRTAVACGNDAPDEARAQVLKLVGFVKNTYIWPSLAQVVEVADERGIELPDFEAAGWTVERLAECCLKVLELSKVRDSEGRISFNDQVWLPVVMGWVMPIYDIAILDEAQDCNAPQFAMVRKCVKPGGRIGAVGDDWQAIYYFRGALKDGMAIMIRELNAKVFPLTITRRCPKVVVRMMQALVPDFKSADDAPEGSFSEMALDNLTGSVKVGDVILSRYNAPMMPIALQLLRKGIPARVEGRDIGAQLKAIVTRMNARSVPQFVSKLAAWVDRSIARSKNSKNAEAKLQLIQDQAATLEALADGVANVREISERIDRLFQNTDGDSVPAVILSSVHKAKGLEWNRVHLLIETFKQQTGEGEEARLFFVACTRTKQDLIFVK
jgi:hypothetical protein